MSKRHLVLIIVVSFTLLCMLAMVRLLAKTKQPDAVHCLAGIPVTDRDAPHAKEVLGGIVTAAGVAGVTVDVMLAHRAADSTVGQHYAEAEVALRGTWSGRVKDMVVDDYKDFEQGPIDVKLQRRLVLIRNALLDTAQQEGYQCFLSIDADVVLQPGTLRRMMESEHEAVTAVYAPRWLRPDASSVLMMLRDEKVACTNRF